MTKEIYNCIKYLRVNSKELFFEFILMFVPPVIGVPLLLYIAIVVLSSLNIIHLSHEQIFILLLGVAISAFLTIFLILYRSFIDRLLIK
jgi:hypothetical protein